EKPLLELAFMGPLGVVLSPAPVTRLSLFVPLATIHSIRKSVLTTLNSCCRCCTSTHSLPAGLFSTQSIDPLRSHALKEGFREELIVVVRLLVERKMRESGDS
ncbi:6466_t:CDS:2, partial [Acaulospora colombiana]